MQKDSKIQSLESAEKLASNDENVAWDISENDIRTLLTQSNNTSKAKGKKELKKIKKTLEKLAELRNRLHEGASNNELLELIKKEDFLIEELDFIDLLLNQSEGLSQFLSVSSKKTIRQPRDLIDNKLVPETAVKKEMSLFDLLENKSLPSNPEQTPLEYSIPSLDLDVSEERLVHTLSVLLSRKSEQWNQDSPNYYMGNYDPGKSKVRGVVTENELSVPKTNETEFSTARLVVSPHELYSTYLGRENYNSDHSKFIMQTLHGLSKKNFFITLTIPSADGKFQKLRTYLSLFQLVILNKDLSKSESQAIDSNQKFIEGKNCVLLFKFSPLFTNNIRERYIEVPEDLHLRIAKAAGSKRVPQCALLLKDLLLREKQSQRYSILRDEDTLIDVLKLRKMRDEGRKKKVEDSLSKSFQICQTIGLLKSVTRQQGKRMQSQYVLEINPDF